jgi:hypothetical protein
MSATDDKYVEMTHAGMFHVKHRIVDEDDGVKLRMECSTWNIPPVHETGVVKPLQECSTWNIKPGISP